MKQQILLEKLFKDGIICLVKEKYKNRGWEICKCSTITGLYRFYEDT